MTTSNGSGSVAVVRSTGSSLSHQRIGGQVLLRRGTIGSVPCHPANRTRTSSLQLGPLTAQPLSRFSQLARACRAPWATGQEVESANAVHPFKSKQRRTTTIESAMLPRGSRADFLDCWKSLVLAPVSPDPGFPLSGVRAWRDVRKSAMTANLRRSQIRSNRPKGWRRRVRGWDSCPLVTFFFTIYYGNSIPRAQGRWT